MSNIIFISGNARSGTTILGHYLSTKFNAFFAGEVLTNREFHISKKLLANYQLRDRKCTCGSPPKECIFWSNLINNFSDDVQTYYKRCIATKNQISGDIPFIDSSKNLSRLKQILKSVNSTKENVHVIHSIKNYKGQIYSGLKYGKSKKKNFFINNSLYYALYWLYSNIYSIIFLYNLKFKKKIKTFTIVFYEDFIFNQEDVFLKIQKKMKFLKLNSSKVSFSHEIGGNDGFVKGKREKLIYQYDWIFSYSIFSPLISLILDPIQFIVKKLSKI